MCWPWPSCRSPVTIMAESRIPIRVNCYAGYRGEETPQMIFIKERAIEVVEVLDRWLAPDHRYFKIRGDDENFYIIRHDTVQDIWELTMFESAALQR